MYTEYTAHYTCTLYIRTQFGGWIEYTDRIYCMMGARLILYDIKDILHIIHIRTHCLDGGLNTQCTVMTCFHAYVHTGYPQSDRLVSRGRGHQLT